MPTYEYECAKCGNRFEIFQKMTDRPAANCPKCDGKAERLIGTGGGVIFKGKGFYANDYKKKDKSCPKADPGSGTCKGCPSNDK